MEARIPWLLGMGVFKRHIYSDGSSLGNPGPGGWGVYVEGEEIKLYGYGGIVTNNQMELKAAMQSYVKKKNLVLFIQIQSM